MKLALMVLIVSVVILGGGHGCPGFGTKGKG